MEKKVSAYGCRLNILLTASGLGQILAQFTHVNVDNLDFGLCNRRSVQ